MTQQEIARLAGVTRKTVSLYFNDRSRVAQKTAAKLDAICEQFGYKPNYAARTIRGAAFRRIACLQLRKITAAGREGIYPQQLQYINGITNVLSSSGYSLEISPVIIDERSGIRRLTLPMMFSESCVDGVIGLPYDAIPANVSVALSSMSLPSVWLNTVNPPIGNNTVIADEENGTMFLTNYLINRGCRNIVWFSNQPPSQPHYSVETRRTGVIKALKQANLRSDMAVHVQPNEEPAEAALRIFDHFPDVDAIISNTAAMLNSYDYLTELHHRGKSFKEAYITSEWQAKDFRKSGACIIIPETELGECAARQLLNILSGKSEPPSMQMIKPKFQYNGQLIDY